MRGPRILILDDSLSAVDTYTEEKILHKLRNIRSGRTTLIVSHRISTIRDADLICVLHEGRIIERGTHDELLALDGEYAELYATAPRRRDRGYGLVRTGSGSDRVLRVGITEPSRYRSGFDFCRRVQNNSSGSGNLFPS